jgi:hypothetical protein
MELLRFGQGNAKLDESILTFALPSGHACPLASKCLAKADRDTGHLKDGKDAEYRCFMASTEARSPQLRKKVWRNFELLRGKSQAAMTELILNSLIPGVEAVRIHTGGDFFSLAYFRAWLEVARQRQQTLFYFYTKSLAFWAKHLAEVGNGHEPGSIANFVPTASYGSKDDTHITRHNLRFARVVMSPYEAEMDGLQIDHDDSHAMTHGDNFALLVHGIQPIGSDASKAQTEMRRNNQTFGYQRR